MNPADRFARLPLWLGCIGLWLLNANYMGLDHDSRLYTFQALNHLHPELYANDVYFRHGSQDAFTIFTAPFAALVGLLGLQTAAALGTFISQLLLLFAVWRLARTLITPWLALLGLAFVLAIPSDFGPEGIFRVVESFITPRPVAQALVLAALMAMLAQRLWLTMGLLAVTLLLHPIVAAPGVALAAYLWLAPRYPRLLWMGASGSLLALAGAGLLTLPTEWRLDATWRTMLDLHEGYLFLSNWRPIDFARASASLATLIVGARVLSSIQARQLCVAATFVAVVGLLITLIGADWHEFPLVIQGQGYRWLWPASLLSVLLLPAIGQKLWQASPVGRAATLALAALWISRSEHYGLAIAPVAVLLGYLANRGIASTRYQRALLAGATGLFAVALLAALAEKSTAYGVIYEDSYSSEIVDSIRTACGDGLIPLAAMVGLYAWMVRRPARTAVYGAALSLLLLVALLAPQSAASWTRRDFDPRLLQQFAAWRRLIPVGSEVVWIDQPYMNWVLLQRPSYYSGLQTASGVFSRDAAHELFEREKSLVPYIWYTGLGSPSDASRKLVGDLAMTPQSLGDVCSATQARFFVTRADLGAEPLAHAPPGVSPMFRALRLYQCEKKPS